MKKLLYLIGVLLVFSNCSFIAKKGYGAKKPGIENDLTISRWMVKHNFDSEIAVSIHPQSFWNYFPEYSQVPMLFDRKTANYVAAGFSSGEFCPKDIDLVFSSIVPYFLLSPKPDNFRITEVWLKHGDSVQIVKDTTKISLSAFYKGVCDLKGKTIALNDLGDSDYILFLPFALFLGNRLQVQELKKYYQAALSNKHSKIKVVFFNLDKQQWWGEEWNSKINFGI